MVHHGHERQAMMSANASANGPNDPRASRSWSKLRAFIQALRFGPPLHSPHPHPHHHPHHRPLPQPYPHPHPLPHPLPHSLAPPVYAKPKQFQYPPPLEYWHLERPAPLFPPAKSPVNRRVKHKPSRSFEQQYSTALVPAHSTRLPRPHTQGGAMSSPPKRGEPSLHRPTPTAFLQVPPNTGVRPREPQPGSSAPLSPRSPRRRASQEARMPVLPSSSSRAHLSGSDDLGSRRTLRTSTGHPTSTLGHTSLQSSKAQRPHPDDRSPRDRTLPSPISSPPTTRFPGSPGHRVPPVPPSPGSKPVPRQRRSRGDKPQDRRERHKSQPPPSPATAPPNRLSQASTARYASGDEAKAVIAAHSRTRGASETSATQHGRDIRRSHSRESSLSKVSFSSHFTTDCEDGCDDHEHVPGQPRMIITKGTRRPNHRLNDGRMVRSALNGKAQLARTLRPNGSSMPQLERLFGDRSLHPTARLFHYLANAEIERCTVWPHLFDRFLRRNPLGPEWCRRRDAALQAEPRVLQTWRRAPEFGGDVLAHVQVDVPRDAVDEYNHRGDQVFELKARGFVTQRFRLEALRGLHADYKLLLWLNNTVLQTAISTVHMLRIHSGTAEFMYVPTPPPPGSGEGYMGFPEGYGSVVLGDKSEAAQPVPQDPSSSAPTSHSPLPLIPVLSDPPPRALLIAIRPPSLYTYSLLRALTRSTDWPPPASAFSPTHTDQIALLQAQLYDECVAHGIRYWVLTTLKYWVFGLFEPDFTACTVSRPIHRTAHHPSVLQCLVTWMMRAFDDCALRDAGMSRRRRETTASAVVRPAVRTIPKLPAQAPVITEHREVEVHGSGKAKQLRRSASTSVIPSGSAKLDDIREERGRERGGERRRDRDRDREGKGKKKEKGKKESRSRSRDRSRRRERRKRRESERAAREGPHATHAWMGEGGYVPYHYHYVQPMMPQPVYQPQPAWGQMLYQYWV